MPPLPPTKLVLDALHDSMLPAAGGAALITCLFLILGRRAAAIGSAMAVVFGFASANYSFNAKAWEETELVVWEGTSRILPWQVEPSSTSAWHHLPRVALILIAVGLFTRWIGLIGARYLPKRLWWGENLLVWAPRMVAVFVVSGWLVSERAASESPGLRPILPPVMILIWATLDGLARMRPGGEVTAQLTAICFAAGTVLLYAHTARFMEAVVILGSATFGIAVAANASKTDVSGAIPAAVAFLPGLVLAGRSSLADNHVPAASFWLIVLAPLLLAPFLLPAVARRESWLTWSLRTVLLLVPLIVAVVLAAQHEELAYE